jgi:hypothetical protein
VILDGDHRSDGRFLEANACLQAEGACLNQQSHPSARACPFAIQRPSCAERGARFGARSLRVTSCVLIAVTNFGAEEALVGEDRG